MRGYEVNGVTSFVLRSSNGRIPGSEPGDVGSTPTWRSNLTCVYLWVGRVVPTHLEQGSIPCGRAIFPKPRRNLLSEDCRFLLFFFLSIYRLTDAVEMTIYSLTVSVPTGAVDGHPWACVGWLWRGRRVNGERPHVGGSDSGCALDGWVEALKHQTGFTCEPTWAGYVEARWRGGTGG